MSAPRLARLLIRIGAGAGHRDDALGDLEEAHQRRRARGPAPAWLGSMTEALWIALTLLGHRLVRAGRAAREALVGFSEIRLAFRLLTRQPLMALTAIVALAVGIGLANVRERLRVIYGATYQLTLTSEPGHGTTARIEVPDLLAAEQITA